MRTKWGTYKLHGAVVDKQVLNLDTPVWSEFEVSSTLWRLAHVAAPGINIFQLVKGSVAHQDVQAVLTETSGRHREHTVHVNEKMMLRQKNRNRAVISMCHLNVKASTHAASPCKTKHQKTLWLWLYTALSERDRLLYLPQFYRTRISVITERDYATRCPRRVQQ